MKSYKISRLSFLFVFVVLSVTTVAYAGENNSIFLNAYQEQVASTNRGKLSTDIKGNNLKDATLSGKDGVKAIHASWITVDIPHPKDYRVHDLITIIVNEASKHATKADAKTERENTIDAILSDWIQFQGGGLKPALQRAGDPKISASVEREFEGKGENKRSDTLTLRITAEIVDVLPNGTLVLEASKKVVTDEDITFMTLTGICRSTDIAPDNSIVSSKVARLEIAKTHKGMSRDAVKRNGFHKFWDTFIPF